MVRKHHERRVHQYTYACALHGPFSVPRAFPGDGALQLVLLSFTQGRDAVHAVEGHR